MKNKSMNAIYDITCLDIIKKGKKKNCPKTNNKTE